jgi:hypothetical protein
MSKSVERIKRLERRARYLEIKIEVAAKYPSDLPGVKDGGLEFDRAELSALRWAIETLTYYLAEKSAQVKPQ